MNVHQQENQNPKTKKLHSEIGAEDLPSGYALKIKSEIMIHASLCTHTLRLNA